MTDAFVDSNNIFLRQGLSSLPRILGFIDRDRESRTYGCCDRVFWHYKTIDFVNARYQEAILALALAYVGGGPANRYFHFEQLKVWAFSIARYWSRLRHADGSTDESYPYERHFCSTAFSLYAVTEALLLLGGDCTIDFCSTCNFVYRYKQIRVANQVACAAVALHNVYTLTREEKYRVMANARFDQLLGMQLEDGSFNEYGGFDLGYDTITLSFLAFLYENCGYQLAGKAGISCANNLDRYINDQGVFESCTMSRSTQFLYPYGFSVFLPSVLKKIQRGLNSDVIVSPSWMDDRYCVPLAVNYLATGRRLTDNE